VPPADPACVSKSLGDCLNQGNANGPSCVSNAADAIESCTPQVKSMTCADYCQTLASGGVFCFAPCVWFCP
jgi:hypothetical protein